MSKKLGSSLPPGAYNYTDSTPPQPNTPKTIAAKSYRKLSLVHLSSSSSSASTPPGQVSPRDVELHASSEKVRRRDVQPPSDPTDGGKKDSARKMGGRHLSVTLPGTGSAPLTSVVDALISPRGKPPSPKSPGQVSKSKATPDAYKASSSSSSSVSSEGLLIKKGLPPPVPLRQPSSTSTSSTESPRLLQRRSSISLDPPTTPRSLETPRKSIAGLDDSPTALDTNFSPRLVAFDDDGSPPSASNRAVRSSSDGSEPVTDASVVSPRHVYCDQIEHYLKQDKTDKLFPSRLTAWTEQASHSCLAHAISDAWRVVEVDNRRLHRYTEILYFLMRDRSTIPLFYLTIAFVDSKDYLNIMSEGWFQREFLDLIDNLLRSETPGEGRVFREKFLTACLTFCMRTYCKTCDSLIISRLQGWAREFQGFEPFNQALLDTQQEVLKDKIAQGRFFDILHALWKDRATVPILLQYFRSRSDSDDYALLLKQPWYQANELMLIDYLLHAEMEILPDGQLFREGAFVTRFAVPFLANELKIHLGDYCRKLNRKAEDLDLDSVTQFFEGIYRGNALPPSAIVLLDKFRRAVLRKFDDENLAYKAVSEILFFLCIMPHMAMKHFKHSKAAKHLRSISGALSESLVAGPDRMFFANTPPDLSEVSELNDALESILRRFRETHKEFIEQNSRL